MAAQVSNITARTVLNPAKGFISRYDVTLNPYAGCGFGCSYCYAAFFVQDSRPWGEWVRVKTNLAQVLAQEMRPGLKIYMSTATDPYQPVEAKTLLTRTALEVMLPFQPRLTIQTRSPMVTRDIDILGQFQHLRVNMTIPTDREDMRLRYEPHAPGLEPRAKALLKLREASIRIGISISPMMPMQNPTRFGQWIRSLDPDEVMALYLKPPRPGMTAAQTPASVIQQMQEDGWTEPAYWSTCADIQAAIDPLPLKQETQGFSPP